jgi:hypothetical protein
MIAKINELKRMTNLPEVKSLCETVTAALSSAIYNGVTPEARFEIERVAIENLFEGLSKHPEDKLVSEWLENEKRLHAIKNIGVRKTINILKETEGKDDQTLMQILEQFEDKVNQYPEALIYEEFISALSGEYNWVPGVTTQLNALSQRVANYKNDIDITKIIETMKLTRSNYLLPLIEDVVNNYLANKTEQTKSFLKETLVKFSYDPFVRDLINIVMLDAKDLQLEYASADVEIEKVYSPLMYLGENEVLFNIKGNYYIKKGNNINKLKKADVDNIDERYKALCEAVNLPNVEIDKKSIKLYVGKDVAVINEDSVTINTRVMNEQELKDAAEVSQWAGNTHFFMLAEALKSNFNEIVEVDFAKRVYMKMDEGHAADIIKLRNNIFITTYDPDNNKAIFYRNINPIQAEKVIKEHMNFDVSKTFADILPNKEKILAQIDEAKKSYRDYMNELNEKIENFKNQDYSEVTQQVIEALEEELREVKEEYKDYVNEIEEYTEVSEGTTVTIDVDGQKYTVPIPEPQSTAKGEEADTEAGIVVGAEHMEDSPASEITFDDDQTELLGDSPSIQADEVDLGVDNVEAAADAAEAGEEEEEIGGEEGEEGGEDLGGEEGGEDELGLGDETGEEGGEDELGLGDEEGGEEEEETEESAGEEEWDEEKDLHEDGEGENEEAAEEIEMETEEAPEELEQSDMEEEEEVEVEDVDVKERPANTPRVFLKKKKVTESLNEHHIKDKKGQVNFILKNKKNCKHTKEELMKMDAKKIESMYKAVEKEMGITESRNVKKKSKNLNENAQIGDTVMFDKNKGYVIGQTNNGDLLVQVQYSTHQVQPGKVKVVGKKQVETTKPPYKFDKETLQNLTTKSLFEQYVKCGIYMGNTPVKLNDCFVKFNEWNDAENESPVNVLVEGRTSILPKDQIRILENINDFANPDNFVEGVLIDEVTGEAVENVLINVTDYTQAVGDTDEVRIVRSVDGDQEVTSVPAALLKTLSV